MNNENSGTLGRNQKKVNTNQPDFTGQISCTCTGCGQITPFWLSAWVKTAGAHAKNPGSKFFSLAATPKDEPSQPISSGAAENFDDDVPF